jgi:hypothetical protein
MNNTDEIQFEERNVSSAVTWGIIAGLYSVVLAFIFRTKSSIITDPYEIFNYGTSFDVLVYLSNWVIRIAITVWVVKIAKKLNRSPLVWGLFGFIFPPITLIVIGFQDYKIGDKNIKKILEELRLDFNSELLHIKSTKDLNERELNEVEIKLKEKFNQKLKDRISDSKFQERMESGNVTGQDKIEEQNTIEAEEEEIVQSVSNQKWASDINKCPACGAEISDNADMCQECGLAINLQDRLP